MNQTTLLQKIFNKVDQLIEESRDLLEENAKLLWERSDIAKEEHTHNHKLIDQNLTIIRALQDIIEEEQNS